MNMELDWVKGSPEELADRLDTFGRLLPDRLESAVEEIMLRIQADAQRLVHVDTGRLRASINSLVERIAGDIISGVIGSNVEYAPYVEADYPYLRPAIEQNAPMIIARVQEAVDAAWRASA